MKLKKLPIGQSSFEIIIEENNLYVDKTEKIYELLNTTKFNFLSRPRRFGKSLLMSTIKNIFLANKDLSNNNAGFTPADMEFLTCEGRIDILVETKDKIYIMEFKCNQSAEKAIEQIKNKNYAEKFLGKGKKTILIGINFDTEKRNITEWKSSR